MQRIRTFPLILIIIFSVSKISMAQEIKVISGTDNSALPYATVTNHTHPLVISCDKHGITKLTALIGDTLSVSYVGYKTARFRFSGEQIQIVSLHRDQHTLPNITVHSCRATKQFAYNNFKTAKKLKGNDKFKEIYGGVIWTKGSNVNAKIAVRLVPKKPHATLKNFSFWLEKDAGSPKSSINTPLLISIYGVSDSLSLPGELISKEPVFYFPGKTGKQTIELDTLHVIIPSNGIYVSLQYVMNETYEWKKEYKVALNAKDSLIRDTVIIRYGGIIVGIRSEDFDLVFYNGIKDEWKSVGIRPISSGDLHTSIKCEAIIKYCSDEKTEALSVNEKLNE